MILCAIALGGLIYGGVQAVKRREEVQEWAAERGWAYRQDAGRPEWTSFLPSGTRRGVVQQADGERQGRSVTVAEYYYRKSGANNQPTHRMAVAVVPLRGSGHPEVELKSRHFGDVGLGMAKAVGMRPEVTGDDDFDYEYKVRAGLSALTPRVRQFTLGANLPPWQVREGTLIIAWPGRLTTGNIDSCVDLALTLAALLEAGPPATAAGPG